MDLSTTLSYYKRPEVQARLVEAARGKEVAVRFGTFFGKRPDVLTYPADVLEFARRRATSFHCSEELWGNPMALAANLSRTELERLRVGWDLILDIDCKDWGLARLIAQACVRALLAHGVQAVSVKFSGNKGFHVGVPGEAFPAEFLGRPLAALFPEAPRAVAHYLLAKIAGQITIARNQLVFGDQTRSVAELEAALGVSPDAFLRVRCAACQAPVKSVAAGVLFTCPACGRSESRDVEDEFCRCAHCQALMVRQRAGRCPCGASSVLPAELDLLAIIDMDTLLLSVRHLYRMPFSLHEKSGLVSVPIALDTLAHFEKAAAAPARVLAQPPAAVFLDRTAAAPGEATALLRAAYDYAQPERKAVGLRRGVEVPPDALPEAAFPPCIRRIGAGLEDGKKRALFILLNFLRCAGWSKEAIREYLAVWNARHPEPLRETIIEGHVRHHEAGAPMLPPNCRAYYEELRVCQPDALCARIKNPLQYAKRKAGAAKERGQASKPASAPAPKPASK